MPPLSVTAPWMPVRTKSRMSIWSASTPSRAASPCPDARHSSSEANTGRGGVDGEQTGASAQQHVGRREANRGAGPRIAERAFIQVDGPAQAQIHIAIESDEVPRHQRHFVEAAGQDLIDADAAQAIAQRDRIRPRADGQQAGPAGRRPPAPWGGSFHLAYLRHRVAFPSEARACRPAHPACRPRPACRRRDRALPSRTARFLRPCLRCACERPPRPASGHRRPCAFPTRPAPPRGGSRRIRRPARCVRRPAAGRIGVPPCLSRSPRCRRHPAAPARPARSNLTVRPSAAGCRQPGPPLAPPRYGRPARAQGSADAQHAARLQLDHLAGVHLDQRARADAQAAFGLGLVRREGAQGHAGAQALGHASRERVLEHGRRPQFQRVGHAGSTGVRVD